MKRLLVFLLLLAAGIAALRLAIGDETAVRANGPAPEQPRQDTPAPPPGVGVSGRGGAAVTQSGPIDLPRLRDVPLGDGRVQRQEVYVLRAEDSRPIREGLQQLLRVTLQLFDDGRHAATVEAREAFVELGTDASGRPALAEQKDIDLRDAVVTSAPHSRFADLRLELGDARVRVGDDEILLTTLPEQPVRMVLGGDRPVTLTGRGARARLPRERDRGLRRADIEISSQPVLVTGDARATARGRMRYVEDTRSGAAQLTLEDDVRLDVTGFGQVLPGSSGAPRTGTAGAAGDPWAARGDQFTGWLARGESRRGDGATQPVWQRMVLVGAPATVDAPGLRLETPRIAVLPGPFGDPFAITAYGGESRVVQTDLRAGRQQEAPVVGVSPRRIHLIRPGDAIAPLHQRFGFPRWTLRPLDRQQIVVFEGDSRLEQGARTLAAQRGLLAIQRADFGTGVVQGFGAVRVVQQGEARAPGREARPELRATGNDGFVLVVGAVDERLRLGPASPDAIARADDVLAAPWRAHRYDVRYGAAHMEGVGDCALVRRPAGDDTERIAVALQAPYDEIRATMPDTGGELLQIHRLHAVLDGRRLVELDVGGLPVKGTFVRGDEQLRVEAPRLLQIGPRSLRLLPMPADEAPWSELPELARTPRLLRTWQQADRGDAAATVELNGPRIDLHHAGGRLALVDAQAVDGDLPQVYARLPQRGVDEPTTVACSAERLRILPFVLTPEARSRYLGGAAGPVADAVFHSVGRPWLLVDRVREFALDDARQGHVQGTGGRLLVAEGGDAALFVGDPDTATPAEVQRSFGGRTIAMSGASVRVYRDDEVHLQAIGAFSDRSLFLPPTMTLREPASRGLLSNMRAVCRGNIDVDPDAVRFGAPVEAFALTAASDDDPDGPHIVAEQLALERSRDTGEVVAAAGRNVVLDWSRLDARAAEIDLDLRTSRCTVRDPNGAVVGLPDGRQLWSPRIVVNYDTWSVSMGRGRISQHRQRQEGER